VYAEDDGAAFAAFSAVRAGLFRTLVTTDQPNEASIFGIQGQLKIKCDANGTTLTTGNRAGSWNYCEMAGTTGQTITLQGPNKMTCGAFGMVDWDGVGALTISSGHILCGFGALTNITKTGGTVTATGKIAAFASCNNASGSYRNWDYGLYLAGCTRGISFDGVEPPADAGNYGQTLDCTWLAVDPGSGGSHGAKLMFSNVDASGYCLYGLSLRCRAAAAGAIAVAFNASASAAIASSGQLMGGEFYLQNSGSYTIAGVYQSTALHVKSWLAAACSPSASALWIDDQSTTKATAQHMVDITMNGDIQLDNVFRVYGGTPGAAYLFEFNTCNQGGGFHEPWGAHGTTPVGRLKVRDASGAGADAYINLFADT
jgi:hypothetical protein